MSTGIYLLPLEPEEFRNSPCQMLIKAKANDVVKWRDISRVHVKQLG